MEKEKLAQLEAEFTREVAGKAGEVDPGNSQDWFSLTLGWALAKGMSPAEAHEFAVRIRY